MKVTDIRNATKFRQTVLLIDDQKTVLDIHAAILKSLKLNLNIVALTNATEALSWLQKKVADLIVTDFHMAPMDGLQFLQNLNALPPSKLSPTIVVTVLNDQKLHTALLSAGASACLTKPVDADALANIARKLLAKNKPPSSHSMVA